MKKIFVLLLALLLCVGLCACGEDAATSVETSDAPGASNPADTEGQGESPDDNKNSDKNENDQNDQNDDEVGDDQNTNLTSTLELHSTVSGIRLLGERFIPSDSQINLDWVGSGIEFVIHNIDRTIIFAGESSAACLFRVYVDGEVWRTVADEEYYILNGKGNIFISALPVGTHTIRIVKVTDPSLAIAKLTSMTYTGTISESVPPANDLYIEFVGGAETVGMGLLGNADAGYSSEDGALAYPYLIAESMKADYAVTGISSGMALCAEGIDAVSLYGLASPARDMNASYGFARKADIVVVNLGAGDFALSVADETVTPEAFQAKYKALLQAIRTANGADSKIVCVYDDAYGDFADAIRDVYDELGRQKAGYYLCRQISADGVLDVAEQSAFAVRMKAVLTYAKDGILTEKEMNAAQSGDGLSISFKDFINA